ncbi:MAG: alanine racemase [Bifidobacteriaceae bacterium]|nr:alanine racemase [Bifidobacteriaceae bacterium]
MDLSQWNFDELSRNNYEQACNTYPAQAIVNMIALRNNIRHLVDVTQHADRSAQTAVMGVVKADAYGHGVIPTALAALAGGASWLGSAQPREALMVRNAGIGVDRCRILCWLYNVKHAPLEELISHDIDVAVGSLPMIDAVMKAAKNINKTARVHVKVDTGFGRNGFTQEEFPVAIQRLAALAKSGTIEVVGQWSHLAVADAPANASFVQCTDNQIAVFNRCTAMMQEAGIAPQVRHLANTAATLTRDSIHFELVRPGIALYGYEPDSAMGSPSKYHLQPAMTLQAQLGTVKHVPAGYGISYGRTYITEQDTSVAIVPIGYADGIHRSASGYNKLGSAHVEKIGGPVLVKTTQGNKVFHVSGRVCMDQFVIDLHGDAHELGVHEGDTVTLFSDGAGANVGEPTADDWAKAADTISYEIFTCLRNRIPRLYLGARDVLSESDLRLLDASTIL